MRALVSLPAAAAPRMATAAHMLPPRPAAGRSTAARRLLRVNVLRLTVAGICGTVKRAEAVQQQTQLPAADEAAGGASTSEQLQADYEHALNFGPAWPGDSLVFGARRPGWPDKVVNGSTVDRWLRTMRDTHGITRVLCLLGVPHLQMYEANPDVLTKECLAEQTCEPELLRHYRAAFGAERVHWHPTVDFDIIHPEQLVEAQTVLHESVNANERIVVHCSAGSGRTGQVLAGWRASHHGVSTDEALRRPFLSMDGTENGVRRNPFEGVGKWSESLQRDIEEHDLKGALDGTVARLPWASGQGGAGCSDL